MVKIRFIRRDRRAQSKYGFYRSGLRDRWVKQRWFGLEVPWLDIRLIIEEGAGVSWARKRRSDVRSAMRSSAKRKRKM